MTDILIRYCLETGLVRSVGSMPKSRPPTELSGQGHFIVEESEMPADFESASHLYRVRDGVIARDSSLEAVDQMRRIRKDRDAALAASDVQILRRIEAHLAQVDSEVGALAEYRQRLRDLPETMDPQILQAISGA